MSRLIKYIAADIESNKWIEFNAVGLYDGKNYYVFNNVKDFIKKVVSYPSGYRIYFHNGGRFDFLFLLEELMEKGYVSFIEKAGGFISITFTYRKKRFMFCDSYTLLPASLEKLIKTFNIKNKKIPLDFSKSYSFSNKRMQAHLKNDVLALYSIITRFYEREGTLKLTIASQAMQTFSNDYFEGYVWQCNAKFDGYFRKNFYKGGRVEVYKGLGKNLYYYDFNSLYPSVMLEEMPIGSPIKTKKYEVGKIGYYHIKLLQTTNLKISPLIYTDATGNYYVNGKKGTEFYVMQPDLTILDSYKIKYKVMDGYYFEATGKVFEDYVNHYYEIKSKTTDEVEKYISKLMLNSLYGKFGQKLWGTAIEVTNKENREGLIFNPSTDLVLVDKKLNVKFKGIHIACYITSLARYRLFTAMKEIGFDNIFYCDTDSIITTKKIKFGTEIGELKLVDKIKEGVFLLPKTYGYINDKGKRVVKFKGFSDKSFSYSELKKLLLKQKTKLVKKQRRMLGFRSSLRRKSGIVSERGTYLKLVEEEKILSNNYTRRKLFPNKSTVFDSMPFIYDGIKLDNLTETIERL